MPVDPSAAPANQHSRSTRVSIDQQHVALPKLYGAPAYARPSVPVEAAPKPFDPDALPIEADMSDDERSFASSLLSHAYTPGATMLTDPKQHGTANASQGMRARTFSLRALAGRFRGND
jgi:hypothetical protein